MLLDVELDDSMREFVKGKLKSVVLTITGMKVNCRSARSQVFRDGGYSYCHIDMLSLYPLEVNHIVGDH